MGRENVCSNLHQWLLTAVPTGVYANNGLFYFHSDHTSTSLSTSLGSSTFLKHGNGRASEGLKKANSTNLRCFLAAFTPFGEYRIDAPEPEDDISDHPLETAFTGHKHNDYIGLIYRLLI